MKSSQYIALDKALFFVGDIIIHRRLGYSATLDKVYKRGAGLITVPDTPENRIIWAKKLPFSFKAKQIIKHFKHQIEQPILNL